MQQTDAVPPMGFEPTDLSVERTTDTQFVQILRSQSEELRAMLITPGLDDFQTSQITQYLLREIAA